MNDYGLIGKGARQISRDDRANEMRRRALEVVRARGYEVAAGLLQYSNSGLTIEHFSNTHRLSVITKAGKVLVVESGNSGKAEILIYTPGLWETLTSDTRGAMTPIEAAAR
jgi:hypothetical protein